MSIDLEIKNKKRFERRKLGTMFNFYNNVIISPLKRYYYEYRILSEMYFGQNI